MTATGSWLICRTTVQSACVSWSAAATRSSSRPADTSTTSSASTTAAPACQLLLRPPPADYYWPAHSCSHTSMCRARPVCLRVFPRQVHPVLHTQQGHVLSRLPEGVRGHDSAGKPPPPQGGLQLQSLWIIPMDNPHCSCSRPRPKMVRRTFQRVLPFPNMPPWGRSLFHRRAKTRRDRARVSQRPSDSALYSVCAVVALRSAHACPSFNDWCPRFETRSRRPRANQTAAFKPTLPR